MVAAFHATPRNCGRRLLPSLVDDIALTDARRTFVSVPRSADLHDGFKDINYSTFATAVNRCAWWIEKELGKSETFETIGYLGPLDLRYPILLLAAIKTGYKVSSPKHRGSCSDGVAGVLYLSSQQSSCSPGVA